MTDDALMALADTAGVVPRWQDAHGEQHDVGPDTLRAVLRAIGFPVDSDSDVRDSRAALQSATQALPPLLTAASGETVRLPGRFRVQLESGGSLEGTDLLRVHVPGYHLVECRGRDLVLAVAPPRCHGVPDGRPFGLAAQLYSLRRPGDGGVGDFPALADFAAAAARHGADALAISPVHAQFSADPNRFSPYAPSSRIMLNALHASLPQGDPALEAYELVDWPQAARTRLAQFRVMFDAGADTDGFAAFRAERGATLEAHARFEALHAHFFGRDPALWQWRDWPAAFRDPASHAVQDFAAEHAADVSFHAWLQFRADRELARAQLAARDSGMRIGLIADLAVGTDGGGSHAWSRQDETLIGLSVGAPPDLLNTRGQDWGITTFSPHGLRRHGFSAFIEMLRSALRHSGGMRIDHAMGLNRLWVVPRGAPASEGAYLRYPERDLLRLVALESRRNGGIVVAEDLGTVPAGFDRRLDDAGILGMRVLWFERDAEGFTPPRRWTRAAAAMTSTHDLATVAGWWRGRDIAWRASIGLIPDVAAAQTERERERAALWRAFQDSGAAHGDPPSADAGARVADAACAHVARAASVLAIVQVEDVLAREEQPNLPSTLDEHLNWRRRLDAPAASVLDAPEVAARLAAIAAVRASERADLTELE